MAKTTQVIFFALLLPLPGLCFRDTRLGNDQQAAPSFEGVPAAGAGSQSAEAFKTGMEKARKIREVAKEKAAWFENITKLEKVTELVEKYGTNGQKAFKILQKAEKAAKYLSAALSVVEAVDGAAVVIGLIPGVEDSEAKVERLLEEIKEDIEKLHKEVTAGFKDISQQNHDLANFVFEYAHSKHYMADVVQYVRGGVRMVDQNDRKHIEQFIRELIDTVQKLQCVIIGNSNPHLCSTNVVEPLFQAQFKKNQKQVPRKGWWQRCFAYAGSAHGVVNAFR